MYTDRHDRPTKLPTAQAGHIYKDFANDKHDAEVMPALLASAGGKKQQAEQ